MQWTRNFSASFPRLLAFLAINALASSPRFAQTLGGITGAVRDNTGAVLPGTVVTAVADETQLTRVQTASDNGTYDFVDLPIGRYSLTFVHASFASEKIPSITVQADHTATVNVGLRVGQVGTCKPAHSPTP